MNVKFSLSAAALALLMSGCLVPEKFAAKANFQADGSYSFGYTGTAVHALAAMQLAQTGKLSPKDNAGLERETAKMQRNPDVRAVVYKGDGRYQLTIEAKRAKGQPLNLLEVVKVTTDKDGIVTISSPELKEKDKREMAQLGIKVDGTLDVTIPKNAEVLSHNATGTPSFFGMVGTYSWKIGRIDQRPVMRFRLKG